jgi:hypothetical protein
MVGHPGGPDNIIWELRFSGFDKNWNLKDRRAPTAAISG